MNQEEAFRRSEARYENAGSALRSFIEELEASDDDAEKGLAIALRKAPDRVKFYNLPATTGIGIEAIHHPIISFDARNWDRGYEIAELILEFTEARQKYERSYAALPASSRPRMKVPADLIDNVS